MFHLTIVIPEKTIYAGNAQALWLTTDEGEQEILPGHAPYFSKVEIGELRYQQEDGAIHAYAVSSGFLQVKQDEVEVIVENALHSKEIDIEKAKEAKERAEALVKTIFSDTEVMKLKAQIKLANLHIATGHKYRTASKNIPDEEKV